jgi:hypothetical protein
MGKNNWASGAGCSQSQEVLMPYTHRVAYPVSLARDIDYAIITMTPPVLPDGYHTTYLPTYTTCVYSYVASTPTCSVFHFRRVIVVW